MLTGFLYDLAKLTFSGVGIGGLSPLVTGDDMSISNYLFMLLGFVVTCGLASIANAILKPNVKP